MMEQILYRRENGYVVRRSQNISQNECDFILNKVHEINSYVKSAQPGFEPMYIFSLEQTKNRYFVKLSNTYQGGRRSLIYHVLVVNEIDYFSLIKDPEQFFNFSKRNFKTIRIDEDGYLSSLKEIIFDDNSYDVRNLMIEYQLNNNGFIDFLSTLYFSLLQHTNYKLGVYSKSRRSIEKIFKDIGYAIFSYLPLYLRKMINVCDSVAPYSFQFDIQFLSQDDDLSNIDAYYDIDTFEFKIISQCDRRDLYLSEIINFNENQITEYFSSIDNFVEQLGKCRKNCSVYVLLKSAILYAKPYLFSKENFELQKEFVLLLLEMDVENQHLVNDLVIALLDQMRMSEDPCSSLKLCCIFYKKIITNEKNKVVVSEKILDLFNKLGNEEKIECIQYVFKINEDNQIYKDILIALLKISNDEIIIACSKEYMILFKKMSDSTEKKYIVDRFNKLFKKGDLNTKIDLFNISMKFKLTEILADYLQEGNIAFFEKIIDQLVETYISYTNLDNDLCEMIFSRIKDIISDNKSDEFIHNMMLKWIELESQSIDRIVAEAVSHMNNKQELYTDNHFMMWLERRYTLTNNHNLKDIYLTLLLNSGTDKIEKKLNELFSTYKNDKFTNNDYVVLDNIIKYVDNNNIVLNIDILTKIIEMYSNLFKINIIYHYLQNTYFECENHAEEVYSLLENKFPVIFNDPQLGKEKYKLYDRYYSKKINNKEIKSVDDIIIILNSCNNLYHEYSYNVIKELYSNASTAYIRSAKLDLNRYEYIKKQKKDMDENMNLCFFENYANDLFKYMIETFWSVATYDTFDYAIKDVYLEFNIDHNYDNRPNYDLVIQFDYLLRDKNWNKIYDFFIRNDYLKNLELKENIIKQFICAYNDRYGEDINSIALSKINVKNLTFKFEDFFNEIDRNYNLAMDILSKIIIFDYLNISKKQAKKELKKYLNLHSEFPDFFSMNIIVLAIVFISYVILITNDYFYFNNLNYFNNIDLRNFYLLCNYALYFLIVIILSLFLLFSLNIISKKTFNRYRFYMLLIILESYLLFMFSIWCTLLLSSFISSLIITTSLLIISIGFHLCLKKKMDIVKNLEK